MRRALLIVLALLILCSCKREERKFQGDAPSSAAIDTLRLSVLQPGGTIPDAEVHSEYEQNAYAISQGKTFFGAFNCVGCHAHGGGGMGPALMDDTWLYGSQPAQIFATVQQGRPNGMPSFRGKLTDDQVWKLVAYVRSLSGLTTPSAASGRDDHMQVKPAEQSMPTTQPRNSSPPK